MSIPRRRVAFLLNKNAKSVVKFLKRYPGKIPVEDLFLCGDIKTAKKNIRKIVDARYPHVFCGGGDGSAVLLINQLNKIGKNLPESLIPQIGILKLGTGNALAKVLKAHSPIEDVEHILNGKKIKPIYVSMVETKNGLLAPFAGIGYDGEIMEDFYKLKKQYEKSPLKNLVSSILGFTVAGLTKTLPRQWNKTVNHVQIKSNFEAYKIVRTKKADEEIYLPANEVLYSGPAPLICIGSIPYVGYGIKLFPFASKRPGFIHLRICNVPIGVCLSNLYPNIWHGYFRHQELHDFLVRDVDIKSAVNLPYQFGGDSMGSKKNLYFKTSQKPILMSSLNWEDLKYNLPSRPLFSSQVSSS